MEEGEREEEEVRRNSKKKKFKLNKATKNRVECVINDIIDKVAFKIVK